MRIRLLILTLLCLTSFGCASSACSSGGCSSGGSRWWPFGSKGARCGPNFYHPLVDHWKVCHHARELASASLERYSDQCGKQSCHFCRGYEQAYEDIATGASGSTPVIPPKHYWGMEFRTPVGYSSSEQWFAGYRTGAAIAEQEGLKEFNTIPVSMIAEPVEPASAGSYDAFAGQREFSQGGY